MEIPKGALILQRALAVLMLGLALALSWVERGSPLAGAIREGRPWTAWIDARTDRPGTPVALFWAVYDPVRRTLAVTYLPEDWVAVPPKKTLGRARAEALKASGELAASARAVEALAAERLAALSPEPFDRGAAGRLSLALTGLDEESEPPLAAGRALKSAVRSPRAWLTAVKAALSGLRRGERDAADALLLAFELRRVPLEAVRPAWLPADADAPAYLARALAPPPAAEDGRAPSVEVLNAADEPGLAGRAAKMMRSRGVDAVSAASASRPRARTIVYDRTGDFARAERVLRALGCREAAVVTRVDHSRVVDASVELGPDCAPAVPDDRTQGD